MKIPNNKIFYSSRIFGSTRLNARNGLFMSSTTVPIDHTDVSGHLEDPKGATQDRAKADFPVFGHLPSKEQCRRPGAPRSRFS